MLRKTFAPKITAIDFALSTSYYIWKTFARFSSLVVIFCLFFSYVGNSTSLAICLLKKLETSAAKQVMLCFMWVGAKDLRNKQDGVQSSRRICLDEPLDNLRRKVFFTCVVSIEICPSSHSSNRQVSSNK